MSAATSPALLAEAARRLRDALGDRIHDDEHSRDANASDFGGLVQRRPALVLNATSSRDVAVTLATCQKLGVGVALAGSSHSQYGQSLGDDVRIDLRGLKGLGPVDQRALTVQVGAGALWRDVADHTYAAGLLPVVLTNNLGTTVGGTLGFGGIGSTSFVDGAQVDHVLELEVVTASGETLLCSRRRNPALFDLVRAGFGACGVVVSATLQLRPAAPWMTVFTVLYEDFTQLRADLAQVTRQRSVQHAWIEYRRTPEGGRLHLIAGVEHHQGPAKCSPAPRWSGTVVDVQTAATWQAGNSGHPFFSVGPRPPPNVVHPWVDVMVPEENAPAAVDALLPLVTDLLDAGVCAITPVWVADEPAPLLAGPAVPGTVLFTFGLYFQLPRAAVEAGALQLMDALSAILLPLGRQYLCGYAPRAHGEWEHHFGSSWSSLAAWREESDPRGILGRGLVQWTP